MVLFGAMTVAALLVGGMGVALVGSVKLPLARRLQIDEARVGGMVSVFGFIIIPVILAAGFLTDHVGKQAVVIAGSVIMAAAVGLLATARQYAAGVGAVALLGGGWALLVNVTNVLTPIAFRGNMAYATNLANVFFGIGAFLTPIGVTLLLHRAHYTGALGILGFLTLLPAGLAAGVDFSAITAASVSDVKADAAVTQGMGTLLGDPMMWLCGLALFFYGPLEASMAAWTTTYLGDKGIREATASSLLSAFWLAFMAARLVTAFTLPAATEPALIQVLSLACVVVLSGVVLSRSMTLAALLVVAAGLVFGPIFPTLMAILLGQFAPALHGRAVGVLFAIGGIGWTVIPMLIGAYARRRGVQRGFSIAVGSAVALCAVALALGRV